MSRIIIKNLPSAVEICSALNAEKKKPWKELLKESKKNKEQQQIKDEIPKELKKDSRFKEFLAVHEARQSKPLWADDNPQVSDASDLSDEDSSQKGDSAFEVATPKVEYENREEQSGSVNKRKNEFKQEITNKKTKILNNLYTVKIRNLPYTCKKKQLKEFFKPLKITSLRMPPKSRGFAYVAFATEKDMKVALTKSRGFLGGHRIDIVKYIKKETMISQEMQTEDKRKQDTELLLETGRIFVRNLCYTTTESNLEEIFSKYGPLAELFLPLDKFSHKNQGIAFISYVFPEHAVQALLELDGSMFQGRRLHLIPGQPKKEIKKEDDDDTNYKKKKETKMKGHSGSSYDWNILFKNPNSVAELIADKYNIEKSALLNRNSKGSIAVRMAMAETQVVTESRKFLIDNGVELDAFSQPAETRSKNVILAKDLPANTSSEELNELFSNYGIIKRIVMPPSRMMALIEFQDPAEAKSAFEKLAYCPFHDLPLFLRWAPMNTFKDPAPSTENSQKTSSKEVTVQDEEVEESENESEHDEETPEGSTVFVKNINFCTTDERFRKHFEKCGPITFAAISKKTDIKAGKMLSMGFGFVQFKDKSSAVKAVQNLQLSKLDGHALELQFAKCAPNAASSVKEEKYEVKKQMTKILVRNIPFEATEKEVKELFEKFGKLKFVRMPLKMDSSGEHRGFGFVEFLSKNEAKRAFETLCHSTHLLGRRLALEWASPKSEDVDEIRKKTAKDLARRAPKKKFTKSKLKEDVAISYVRNTTDE